MKETTWRERQITDLKICNKCTNCCLCCNKYKSVKEQNAKCEVRKARKRITDREIRRCNKSKKEGK